MIGRPQKNYFSILIILLFFAPTMEAQIIKGKSNKLRAKQAIIALHEGALVVRLKTKRNKIEKLQESLASDQLSEKDRKRLTKELQSTIEENEKYNTELIAAFNNNYKFSAVYFMYDTSSVTLKIGGKSGFLLNKELKVDPQITITQDSFFVVYNGELDATNSPGIEALIVMDSRFEVLPSPFPYYVKSNSFWLMLGRIFSSKNAVKRDVTKVVTELDHELNFFYKQHL